VTYTLYLNAAKIKRYLLRICKTSLWLLVDFVMNHLKSRIKTRIPNGWIQVSMKRIVVFFIWDKVSQILFKCILQFLN